MTVPTRKVLVTDLDNTLFDWVGIWHACFSAMFEEIAAKSGLDRDRLLDEFHEIHQRHGTTEYAFSIEELPSLKEKHVDQDVVKLYDSAIHKFRIARKQTLKLYPGVMDTLQHIKNRGTMIIGYTESMAFYSMFRVKRLGLDGILDILYSPKDHDLPLNMRPDQIRMLGESNYHLARTQHRHTPEGELKPNPRLLLDILADVGASPEEALYVGDNLMKDVAMAQEAGVLDVFAQYGEARHRPEYELLRRVTHWTPAAVERERKIKHEEIKPTITLAQCFNELSSQVNFEKFIEPIRAVSDERLETLIDVWKKTVDVQQHFNDIEMRIRNYALTIIVAVIGFAGIAVHRDLRFHMFGFDIPAALPILGVTFFAWAAFYLMDKFWYHRLLVGSVKHGQVIEEKLRRILPELRLTKAIGEASPVKLWRWNFHSDDKINVFYALIAVVLFTLTVGFFFDIRSELPGMVE